MSLGEGGRSTPAKQRRLAIWFVSLGLVSGLMGWVAGTRMVSSTEAAARHRPPGASLLTAKVEQRSLRSEAITRGTLARSSEQSLVAMPPDDPQVVSAVTLVPLKVEDVLHEGALALEVGGRPVFILGGALPAFRDLRLGDAGVDVDQLRAALRRLGFLDNGGPGPFDQSVVSALVDLYASHGYKPPGGGPEAQAAVNRAQVEHLAAKTALEELKAGRRQVSQSERLQAEAAVAAAEHALSIADATTAAEVEEARRMHAVAAAEAQRARTALQEARDRLRQAEDGRHPDTGAPPTPSELEELRTAVSHAEGSAAAAETVLLEREHDVELAQLRRAAELDAARAALRIAETDLHQLGVLPPPTQAELRAAELRLQAAQAAWTQAQRLATSFLPRSEVTYSANLPASVTEVKAQRGDSLDGPFATISGPELRIDAGLPSSAMASVHVGDVAIIDDVGAGISFEAALVEIADAPATDGEFAGRFAISLAPIGSPPEAAVGLSLRIRIPVKSTGDDSLIVPVTALSTAADGSVFVERMTDGQVNRVPVQIELAAGGYAAVTPRSGDDLSSGDEVVVGLTDG